MDSVELDQLRARVGKSLFGEIAKPSQLGRFVLLEPIGQGGMGVVYAAYDPRLDRRVALKLLKKRADQEAQDHDLMLREARALAKLSHPNVVPIHEAVIIGEHLVIVMEFVNGPTLAQWSLSGQTDWSRTLELYLQAGWGLDASHSIGIVHRDFKPQNVLVGEDGRVRVVDFGLAHIGARQLPFPAGLGSTKNDAQATRDDRIVGTPRYMAPEQSAGQAVDHRADQFSFCVALYEALFGVHPFKNNECRSDSERALTPTKRSRVPKRIVHVLLRGLNIKPADRYPSMAALLRELSPRPRRLLWILGGTLMITATVVFLVFGQKTTESCEETGLADNVYSAEVASSLKRHFNAFLTPYSAEIIQVINHRLSRYTHAWKRGFKNACVEHRDGLQSDDLFDRRMACLLNHLHALEQSVIVIGQTKQKEIAQSIEVVDGLPNLEDCADVDSLLQPLTIPPPGAAERVGKLQEQLVYQRALERAGRLPEALDIATKVVMAASEIHPPFPPTNIEAALASGRVLIMQAENAKAIAPLRWAEAQALANGLIEQAVEASARRLFVEAVNGRPIAEMSSAIEMIQALSRSLPLDSFARILLLNNIGVIFMANNDRARAKTFFDRASELVAHRVQPEIELLAVNKNRAMVTDDDLERAEMARSTWENLVGRLGRTHPLSLEALYAWAHFTTDLVASRDRLGEVCQAYRQFHADQMSPRSHCFYYLGFLESELGNTTEAIAAWKDVADHASKPRLGYLRSLARGELAYASGKYSEALREFELAKQHEPTSSRWWIEKIRGQAEIGQGKTLLALKESTAIEPLARALVRFRKIEPINEDVEHAQLLAKARILFAEAVATNHQKDHFSQALRELALAKDWYAQFESYQDRLGLLETLTKRLK